MHQISIPAAKKLVKTVAVELRHPVMLWGQPGVGKSEMVAQVADELNGELVDIRLSQYDSVDLRGIPVPNEQENLTVWHAPATLPFKGNPRFKEDKHPIILFLDEINSAAPAVAAVAYQLTNDRRVGEHVLMDNVIIVAAGNREGDKGVTNRMPTPLANRFTHAEVTVSVEAWGEHLMTIDRLSPEARNVGVAFIHFRKNLLSTFDDALKQGHKSFATPRSWLKALQYFDSKSMGDDIKMVAMAGSIGDGPTAEFWGFVDVWHKMIPLSEILKDPKKARLPDEPAMSYAVAVNCSGALNAKDAAAIHTYLCRLDPEFVVMAWQLAVKRDKGLFSLPEFIDFANKYGVIFE